MEMLREIKAVIKKNRTIVKRAYPWSFIVSRVVGGICALLEPIIIYFFIFEKKMSVEYMTHTNNADYLQYLVIGEMINVLSFSILMGVGRCLITEQREGTLDVMLMTPVSRHAYYLGCYIEQFGRSLSEAVVIFVFGIVLGVRVPIEKVLIFCVSICVSSVAFFSVSIFVSSIMIYTRDTYIVQNTFLIFMAFICGVAFPVDYLPLSIRYLSNFFPLTYAVKISRRCIADNNGICIEDLFPLVLLSIMYYSVGYLLFRLKEKSIIEEVLS